MNPEGQRLAINAGKKVPLEQWGPYLSERQWGTVREDYSINGDAWRYFPFEHPIAALIYGRGCRLPDQISSGLCFLSPSETERCDLKERFSAWLISRAIMEGCKRTLLLPIISLPIIT
jgi:hypothetical protein